jgi:hypothetical protein
MFGQIFSNRTIRKYVIFFGSLFDNVYVTRDASDGSREQTMKVPLNYGPKEKFLARLEGNPDLDREIALQLPRMSFEITNMYYDAQRKLASTQKIVCIDPANPNGATFQYVPMPYNIEFSLHIMTKSLEDRYRIVEAILPFFGPDFTGSVILAGSHKYDIPVVLNSITSEDTYEGEFTVRRALISTLNFTLKGYIFGPTRSGSLITQAEVYLRIPEDFENLANVASTVAITITPGLTANGEPTSNAALTIDRSLIGPDDNYAYIIDIEETL